MRRILGCLMLFILFPMTPLVALESAWVSVDTHPPAMPIEEKESKESLQYHQQQTVVIGEITLPGFQIQTVHHVALYDEQGRTISLYIDRSSLRFTSDRITRMRIAFYIPDDFSDNSLRLVWSLEKPLTTENQERSYFFLAPGFSQKICTFVLVPVHAPETQATTFLVEVSAKKKWFAFWYLIPMLVIGVLAIISGYLRKEL